MWGHFVRTSRMSAAYVRIPAYPACPYLGSLFYNLLLDFLGAGKFAAKCDIHKIVINKIAIE